MEHLNIIIKYCLLLTTICIVFNSKATTQDTVYVDQLIDSAHKIKSTDWILSKKLTDEALQISKNSNYTTRQVNALNLLGYLYFVNLNKYDSAYQFIYKALELSELNNYKYGICDHFVLIGIFNKYTGNYAQAKIYFSKSVILAEQINNKKLLANSQYSLSQIAATEDQNNKALDYINSAIKNYRLIGNKNGEAESKYMKSQLYQKIENIDSSLFFIKESKLIYESLNDLTSILECNYAESLILIEKEEFAKAMLLLNKCIQFKEDDYKANNIKIRAIRTLSDLYGKQKNYDKAYIYLKEYEKLIDSIYSIGQIHTLNNLEKDYENAIEEKEKQALLKEKEIDLLKLRKKKIVNWLLLFIIIQALTFAILVFRKYKFIKTSSEAVRNKRQLIFEQEKVIEQSKNEKIKQNLEIKKRELAVKVFQIFQGNQFNQKLLAKLQSLRYKIRTNGEHGEEIRDQIQSMVNDLKFSTDIKIWDEFEMYFDKINPGFKTWLINTYTNLTDNEIRLCFFSQLNLKTKEISNITLQSQKGINVTRTRLRKKLGIEGKDTFVSSYLLCKFTEYQKSNEFGNNYTE